MYFNIRELLSLEKEGLNRIHRQVDIRDYFEVRTGKVIAFTSFQKFFIQEHFNIVYDLNRRDIREYERHEELNGNIYDYENPNPESRPRKCDSITEEFTEIEWLQGWTKFAIDNKILTISSGLNFRKFVHSFEVNRYGYVIPELIYRFAVLEGRGTKLTVDTKVGDTGALQHWRDTNWQQPHEQREDRRWKFVDFSDFLKAKVAEVFAYFGENNPEDLDPNYRPDFAEIRPKSHWEPTANYCKWLQTSNPAYEPSVPYQRVHYENISEGTQTDFTAGHFGITAKENFTWPYIGEKDWDNSIIGAPRYIWSRKRDREDEGEDIRPEPRHELAQGEMNGNDVRMI